MNAHIKKVKAVEDAKELFSQLDNDQKINERIKKAVENFVIQQKRKLQNNQDNEEKNDDETDEVSYINLFLIISGQLLTVCKEYLVWNCEYN